MVTNKFFDTTPPPGDPGSTDPSDRPFLNFTRRQQTQNSTLPIIPDALDTPMANQFGDVYTPALPMSPETAPPPAPTFEPDDMMSGVRFSPGGSFNTTTNRFGYIKV